MVQLLVYRTFFCSVFSANRWLKISIECPSVVMIGNAQRPLFFQGLDIFVLNLETFARVSLIWWWKKKKEFKFEDWNESNYDSLSDNENGFTILHDAQSHDNEMKLWKLTAWRDERECLIHLGFLEDFTSEYDQMDLGDATTHFLLLQCFNHNSRTKICELNLNSCK